MKIAKSDERIQSFTLANGLEVYLIPKTVIPMVTVLIAVRNGAFIETAENNGLAHLYEHMFFKANEKIPSQPQFLRTLDELGIELGSNMNAHTSTEFVRYFFTLQSAYLERGLQFMADALLSPKFLPEELEREKKVVIGEFDRYEASPSSVFFQRSLMGRLFQEHFVRKNTIGNREIILKASQAQMHEIQHRYYIPNNAALFIVGDFDEAKTRGWVETMFGSWERGPQPLELYPVPEHPPLTKTEELIETGAVQNVTIVEAFHGPSLTKQDQAIIAFDLISMMLSLESSPFQKELVHSGLASSASLSVWSQRYTSPLMLYLETTPENAQKAYEKMSALLARMLKGGFFTEKDLQSVKTSVEVSSAFDRERGQRFALNLASIWSSTGTLDFYTDYNDEMKKITLADIDRALQTYLNAPSIRAALMPKGSKPIQFSKKEKPKGLKK